MKASGYIGLLTLSSHQSSNARGALPIFVKLAGLVVHHGEAEEFRVQRETKSCEFNL